jgi:CHASE3 domain sensor protein
MMPEKLLSRLRGSPFAFPLAALAALAMLLISESSYHQVTSTFDGLEVHGRARLTIQQLWRSLTDAETGQRGYLLTGRPEYLKPYKAGEGQTDYALNWLNTYYAREDVRAGHHAEAVRRRQDRGLALAYADQHRRRADGHRAPAER